MTGDAVAAARLQAKVIIVTGASSGIGLATAVRLAAEEATVIIASRGVENGERAAASIRASGGEALFIPTDVTVESEVARMVQVAVDRFGRLDGAFNNAGAVLATGQLADLSAEAWAAELQMSLTSSFYCIKHQGPVIAAAGGGSIVNNASVAGLVGVAGMGAYTAAKHRLIGLTRSAALEWAADGVRVNALATGNVDTPLFRRLLGVADDGELVVGDLNPSRRVSRPEEIAALVAFLLSNEAGFITGAAVPIDGGLSAG